MARTSPPKYDLISHSNPPEGFWKLKQTYVPKEEQKDLNLKHPPWTVPMKRKSRGRDTGHFSYIYNSEGDFYFPTGRKLTTSNRFGALQDLQDICVSEEEVSEEKAYKKEDKKEDVSLICNYNHSSFDNFMYNNNLLYNLNFNNNCKSDYTVSVPVNEINSCQGYFPEFIFPSNCSFNSKCSSNNHGTKEYHQHKKKW